MKEEIAQKIYDTPRVLFHDVCFAIADHFSAKGFKFLKSQQKLKKSDKIFNYVIYFSSSHYNYIDKENGHVHLRFWCYIESKKNQDMVFYLSQKTLMGLYDYELFKKGGKCNMSAINIACDFIDNYFLPITKQIENEPNHFLEKICTIPAKSFDDYHYYYKKEIFTILDRPDLVEEYEKYMNAFKDGEAERHRDAWKRHMLSIVNKNFIESLDINYLKQLLQKIHNHVEESIEKDNKSGKNGGNSFLTNWKEYYNILYTTVPSTIDWYVEFYMFQSEIFTYGYIRDENLKKELTEFHKEFTTK